MIVRFPPSPTGNLHIGGARTALFNYLFAKKHGGKIYLRLEDTDRERSKPEFERNILDGLAWLDLAADTLPDGKELWRQSERADVYRTHLKKLVASGAAYLSQEKERERREVVRFKNPGSLITFHDIIRGPITFDTKELGDFVIAKSIEEPLYHLAVVIDDAALGITHVIRGEDHISNTPRQILLQRALGFAEPLYAHIPLILAPDRSKLSKRHGAVAVTEYREQGYLPEALVNYLALLGWNPGTDREIFSLDELAEQFDLKRVQRGGAIFNAEKLNWINKEWLRTLPPDVSERAVRSALATETPRIKEDVLARALPTILERIGKWGDVRALAEAGELDYLRAAPKVDPAHLPWKGEPIESTREHLAEAAGRLERVAGAFSKDAITLALMPYAEEKGKGNVLWPVRFALSGREKSPDPFTLAYILGKEETLRRLAAASNLLS
ncbi:MAG: glutamyl-tRNA synthetase [Parcubacteria group bacterium Gr01-1014_72]|nr:MAG: glutamyl-tRNA synthetase [Parcubacteria group bacterium Gr01-1014_72]